MIIMTFWRKAERFPPIQCRLLARLGPGGPAMTNVQIARETGLSVRQVMAISEQTDWRGIDLPTMQRFLEACGVDFEDARAMKRVNVYLRGKTKKGLRIPPPFDYLRASPDWPTIFKPLAERLLNHATSK